MARRPKTTTGHQRRTAAQPLSVWPRLVRPELAARYLSIGKSAVEELRRRGDLHPVALPAVHREGKSIRCVLYDIRDLDSLVDRLKERAR
jgi:hypothetical protein